MSSSHQRIAFRSSQLVIFIPILMFGSARTSISSPDDLSDTGAYGGVNTSNTSYGSVSECEHIQLDSPPAGRKIDLFGLGLTGARLYFDAQHPDFLNFAIDVSAR